MTEGRFARQAVAMLEIEIRADGQVRNIVLDQKEVIIGRRNEQQEVHLDLTPDESVSRVHARVWENQGDVFIEDLSSKAGTRCGGMIIEAPMQLDPDTEVQIGDACLSFHCSRNENRREGPPIKRSSLGRVKSGQPDGQVTELSKSKPDVSDAEEATNRGIHVDLTSEGAASQLVFNLDEIFVGRKNDDQEIHVDLSGDLKVSRVHARVWRTRNICWVEDMASTHGTLVNGESLNGARVVKPEDTVQIGDVMMQFCYASARDHDESEVSGTLKASTSNQNNEHAFEALDSYPVYKEDSYRYHPKGHRGKSDLESIFQSRKSPMGRIRAICEKSISESFFKEPESKVFIESLPDIVLRLNNMSDSKSMAEWFVQSVSGWVAGAERASVFAVDKKINRIRLLAHRPALKPILSDTLTHRAWEEGLAFSWRQVEKKESVRRLSVNAGLYVPMMVLNEEVGMLCVEDTTDEAGFSPQYLDILMVVGQLMALPLLHRIQAESV